MSAAPGRTHELRTTPAHFEAVWDGSKVAEVRWNDRGYQAGDRLQLMEWDPSEGYTGRAVLAAVTYVLESTAAHGRQPGFRGNGYAVLSLRVLDVMTDAIPSVPARVPLPPQPAPAAPSGLASPADLARIARTAPQR